MTSSSGLGHIPMTPASCAGRIPMTPAGCAGAMAAGAESEERRLRGLIRLQAAARGFLLRRRLRGLREEFEAAVLEIEGHLRHLSWTGSVLQTPRFGDCPHPARAGFVPAGAAQPRGSAQLSPGTPLCAGEAAQDEPIPTESLENPEPPGAEGAGGFGNIPPSAPVPRGIPPNPTDPPSLGSGAAQRLQEEGRAQAGGQQWDSDSASASSAASPEIPADLRGLSPWELQAHRRHLLMELLWLQQAMNSRKHFLMLKQKLGISNHSGGIPEFLDWCGEALQLQHRC